MQIKGIFLILAIVLPFIEFNMMVSILLHCFYCILSLGQKPDSVIPIHSNYNNLNPIQKHVLKDELIQKNQSDTTKLKDTIVISGTYYVIAGSFLIPNNAENQILKLKKLGFSKCFKQNFPESEFYSVVVDTFKAPVDYSILIENLQKNKIEYFIKNH